LKGDNIYQTTYLYFLSLIINHTCQYYIGLTA